jgi:hypothetical protein
MAHIAMTRIPILDLEGVATILVMQLVTIQVSLAFYHKVSNPSRSKCVLKGCDQI